MTPQQTGSPMRQSTPLFTVALAIAFAACLDGPPASIVDVDVPVPGDPAIYAPDGWPLRIGDRVTDEDRDRLRKEFLSPYQWAIHVVGDQLQAARWDWPDEPHDYARLVYAGHFPATMPWYARDEEQGRRDRGSRPERRGAPRPCGLPGTGQTPTFPGHEGEYG